MNAGPDIDYLGWGLGAIIIPEAPFLTVSVDFSLFSSGGISVAVGRGHYAGGGGNCTF